MDKLLQMKKLPLRIKYWEFGVNLREACWSEDKVNKLAKKHKLKDYECVILFNNSKHFNGCGGTQPPKCRMYIMLNGIVMTCIPPVSSSSSDQTSFMLKLSIWIRSSFGSSVDSDLDANIDNYIRSYKQWSNARKSRDDQRELYFQLISNG